MVKWSMSTEQELTQRSQGIVRSRWERLSTTVQLIISGIVVLAAIVTLGVPLMSPNFPSAFIGDYILAITLTAVVVGSIGYRQILVNDIRDLQDELSDLKNEISNLEDEIEEANAYQHLIDQKNTSPVLVNEKNLQVDIFENNPDEVTFTLSLSALEGNTVYKYTALIGTDNGDTTWEDLDFTPENGSVSTYRRRDFEDLRRFVVEIDLYESVEPDETYELSYSLRHDVMNPEDDYVFTLIRERTDRSSIDVKFPERWEPQRKVSYGRGDLEIEGLQDPESYLDDDGHWHLDWECNNCNVGQSYVVDFTAEQTN